MTNRDGRLRSIAVATAAAGLGAIVLASIGDASVVAATGGVYVALERAGLQDQLALRDELYGAVLMQKNQWAVAQLGGLAVLLLGLAGLWTLRRK